MPSNDERARSIIELVGDDGYSSAAKLVGADRADELLADLVRRNMTGEGYAPKKGQVEEIIATIRKKKGF